MSSVTSIGGYPVSLLVDAWRKRGGSASMADNILTLTLKDRLTGRTNVTRLEMRPATLPDVSDQCGPGSLVVMRASVNDQETSDLDVGGLVESLVLGAASQPGVTVPKPINHDARSFVPSPPAPITGPPAAQPTPLPAAGATPPSSAPNTPSVSADQTPALGNCHMDSCSWAKTLSRVVRPGLEGSVHTLTLLGGSTANGDESAAHIVWNAQPHTVSITCSLTHPSVATGDQIDDLPLNAAGSPVPDVLIDSYTLYARRMPSRGQGLGSRRFGQEVWISGEHRRITLKRTGAMSLSRLSRFYRLKWTSLGAAAQRNFLFCHVQHPQTQALQRFGILSSVQIAQAATISCLGSFPPFR